MQTVSFSHIPRISRIRGFVGCMASGKTTQLINATRMPSVVNAGFLFLEPKTAARHEGGHVVARSAMHLEGAESFQTLEDIERWVVARRPRNLFLDDAQFLEVSGVDPLTVETRFQGYLASGMNIYWAGLKKDFANRVFPVVATLASMCHPPEEFFAECAVCGRPIATFSQRLEFGHPVPRTHPRFLPDTADSHLRGITYEPRCEEHYQLPDDWNEYSKAIHVRLAQASDPNPSSST